MSNEMKSYVGLYARGNAAQGVGQVEAALKSLGERGERHLGRLGRSMQVMGGTLDKLGNRYTALFSTAAAGAAIKQVSDLDTRMTYLGITAEKSTAEMDALKRKVFEVANAADTRVDTSELFSAFETIVEKTGDFDMASENLRNMALAMRATNAAGTDVGDWFANLSEKFDIRGAEAMLAAVDHSINAGKIGAFAFKDLATQGNRISAAYAAMGRTGPQAAAELDAMMQMFVKGVGGPEQAATALEAYMRIFQDANKLKQLKAVGISVMDPEDPKRMRSGVAIMKDLILRSKGNTAKLSTIFDGEAMRTFNAAIIEYNKTGKFESFDNFLNVASDGKTLMQDATRGANTFGAALQSLHTEWQRFADANLTGAVRGMAEALNGLEPEKVQDTMRSLAWGAGIVGGILATAKLIQAGQTIGRTAAWIMRGPKKNTAAMGAEAGAAAGGGPLPVIVMNWPAGGAVGAGGATAEGTGLGRRVAARGGRFGRMLAGARGVLSRGNVGLALATGAVDAGMSLASGDSRGVAGAVGRTGGALGGAALGAAAGSVVPVVGTAIGGLVGGIAGAYGGEELLKSIYDWLAADNKAKTEAGKPAKVEGSMRLDVGLADGVTASIRGVSGSPGFDVDAGVGYTTLGSM